eukprot:CAMPEP_0178383174 /NCGR_PEP_ID=MMETSP0689_2-20121128/6867_1 /TAXON_ID=160604 /ORGANISM="Amphidinium massartii, Strain CS-259" /LENGTH=783 /DNA_ID=CAMNT_0020003389 /DNA_START=42 /DNA_END=2389 /DNA_ORIENTATION=+
MAYAQLPDTESGADAAAVAAAAASLIIPDTGEVASAVSTPGSSGSLPDAVDLENARFQQRLAELAQLRAQMGTPSTMHFPAYSPSPEPSPATDLLSHAATSQMPFPGHKGRDGAHTELPSANQSRGMDDSDAPAAAKGPGRPERTPLVGAPSHGDVAEMPPHDGALGQQKIPVGAVTAVSDSARGEIVAPASAALGNSEVLEGAVLLTASDAAPEAMPLPQQPYLHHQHHGQNWPPKLEAPLKLPAAMLCTGSCIATVDAHSQGLSRSACWPPQVDDHTARSVGLTRAACDSDIQRQSHHILAPPITARQGRIKSLPRSARVRAVLEERLTAHTKVADYTSRGTSFTTPRAKVENSLAAAPRCARTAESADLRAQTAGGRMQTSQRPTSVYGRRRVRAAIEAAESLGDAVSPTAFQQHSSADITTTPFECDIHREALSKLDEHVLDTKPYFVHSIDAAAGGAVASSHPGAGRSPTPITPSSMTLRKYATWMQGEAERPVLPKRIEWARDTDSPPPPQVGTLALLKALKHAIQQDPVEEGVLMQLGSALELRSYDLLPRDALQAMALLVEGSKKLDAQSRCTGPDVKLECSSPKLAKSTATPRKAATSGSASEAMFEFTNRVALSIVGRFFHATPEVLADVFTAMANTKLAVQEYLDAGLSRLLLLLRTQAVAVKLSVLVQIARAIGCMTRDGGLDGCKLCARAGANPRQQDANRRCLDTLNMRLLRLLQDFKEADLEAVFEAYAMQYLNEDELRRMLRRAAQLRMGLRSSSLDTQSTLLRRLV